MTTAGLIFMVLAWTAIITLLIFCFSKILREPEEKIIGPLETEVQSDIDAKKRDKK